MEQKISVTFVLPGRTMVKSGDKIHIRAAKQVINMPQEAYDEMTSRTRPYKCKMSDDKWGKLSRKNRLEWHLESIKNDLKAISYTVEVFK